MTCTVYKVIFFDMPESSMGKQDAHWHSYDCRWLINEAWVYKGVKQEPKNKSSRLECSNAELGIVVPITADSESAAESRLMEMVPWQRPAVKYGADDFPWLIKDN